MAGFRGFPLLFLLPLILGCFLSFSTAGSLNRKRRRSDFENADVIDLVTVGPEPEMFYRALLEEADSDTQYPESAETGYRGLFGREFVTKIPPFGPKFRELEEGTESNEEDSESEARYRGLKYKRDFTGELSESAGTRYRSLSEESDSAEEASQPEVFFRGLREKVDFVTQVPQSAATGYRELLEGQDAVTQIPYYAPLFRDLSEEKEERLGFRLKFFDEMKQVLENFDQKYVDNMSCQELKERMTKIVEFVRSSLGFIK